jgi:hypothetical protein
MSAPRPAPAARAPGRARRLLLAALSVLVAAGWLLLDQAPPVADGDQPLVSPARAVTAGTTGSTSFAASTSAPDGRPPQPMVDLHRAAHVPAAQLAPPASDSAELAVDDSAELAGAASAEIRAALPARHDVIAQRLGWRPDDARVEALRSWIEDPGGRRPEVLLEQFGREVAEAVAREVPPIAVDGATHVEIEVDLQGRRLPTSQATGTPER